MRSSLLFSPLLCFSFHISFLSSCFGRSFLNWFLATPLWSKLHLLTYPSLYPSLNGLPHLSLLSLFSYLQAFFSVYISITQDFCILNKTKQNKILLPLKDFSVILMVKCHPGYHHPLLIICFSKSMANTIMWFFFPLVSPKSLLIQTPSMP